MHSYCIDEAKNVTWCQEVSSNWSITEKKRVWTLLSVIGEDAVEVFETFQYEKEESAKG